MPWRLCWGLSLTALLLVLLLVLTPLLFATAARADGPWQGTWRIHWRDTSGEVVLRQDGDKVIGDYPLYDGRLEGTVKGRNLEAIWHEGDLTGTLSAVIARDGQSFVGKHEDREWFSASRVPPGSEVLLDYSTPQAALRAFASQGARGRSGDPEAWGRAARAVDFGAATHRLARRAKIAMVRNLYALVDLTTFQVATLAFDMGDGTASVVLPQPRSDARLPLTLVRDATGAWRIRMPSEAELATARKALLADRNGQMPSTDAFQKLQSPRDAMRALIEGTARWSHPEGQQLALSSLNLNQMPTYLREPEGKLTALMLRHVLSVIGFDNLQAVPDDGRDRAAWDLFVHPEGKISIAPTGHTADAPWRFTSDTVRDIDQIYRALDDVPHPGADALGHIPTAPYFMLRDLVEEYAPILLMDVGHSEYWQLIGAVVFGTLGALAAVVVSRLLLRLLIAMAGESAPPLETSTFGVSLTLLLALLVGMPLPVAFGIPETIRQYTMPLVGVSATVALAVVIWHLLEVLALSVTRWTNRTTAMTDDILVTLLLAAARLVVVGGATLMSADFLSIPASSIVAGLGIGGLALAFASRETLSNVFGAGILVADRPFRRGDWIHAGEVQGAVEHVGIRSTRVRTSDGSVMVVPNGTLADSVIDNRGTRPQDIADLKPVVTAGGTPERLAAFMDAVRAHIAADPRFGPSPQVGLGGITESGIMINVTASLAPAEAAVRRLARQELLLDLVRIAVRCGVVLGGGMGEAADSKPGQADAHAPHDPLHNDPRNPVPHSHRREDLRGRHAIGGGSHEIGL